MTFDLKKLCQERVVVFDGAMGTSIQALDLTPDDFWGKTGCNEILNLSRPHIIQSIHAKFLEAGCQIIETNTFGANGVVLAEYDLADRVYEINQCAAALAKRVARDFSASTQTRYVAGSIGPGTKLPSLGQISFSELKNVYQAQVAGLIAGGVDLLVVETCQDLLQMKAALVAIQEVFAKEHIRLPIQAQVTMETTGKLLVGSDLRTVITVLAPFEIDGLGINCATGPKAMTSYVRLLAQYWPRLISVIPNAGLPRPENGKVIYDLTPGEFAQDLKNFVVELGVNIVGGCCGTEPAHIRALVAAVENATPPVRQAQVIPAAASLYQSVEYDVKPKPLIIGERNNANGSKQFREYLLAGNFDEMVALAKQQEKEQAHLLDLCTAYVGQNEMQSMVKLVQRLNTESNLPLMIDSTHPEVIEQALQHISGKAIINSVNLENGPAPLRKIITLCKKYGAAVVALTIDEDGMAKTAARKMGIARRLYHLLTTEFNFPPEDIFFDMLTFTLGSGEAELRHAAIETLAAIRTIKQTFPACQTILGISNISYGLKPSIRHRLNSVFLAHAIEAGLDTAILHPGKIMPLFQILATERKLLEDLIFDRRRENHDPLLALLNFYKDKKIKPSTPTEQSNLSVEEKLKQHILEGNRSGLTAVLDECLQKSEPLTIINELLLPAMKTVGTLFSSGEMQLPFVLQSAETMKAAVAYLEPRLNKSNRSARGTIVLATVAGDVHDIGKNLVDIILTNNGYEVINLGIKQNIEAILAAFQENNADAIGMSGLLVKSTLVMQENLRTLNSLGITPPVLLGGAALTRDFVEKDLRQLYQGAVYYARDAFDGLTLMESLSKQPTAPVQDSVLQAETQHPDRRQPAWSTAKIKPVVPPRAPFYGRRVVKNIPLTEIAPLVNKSALFAGRWQMKPQNFSKDAYQKMIKTFFEPEFEKLLRLTTTEKLLTPAVVYGYFACNSEDNSLHVFEKPADATAQAIFHFPNRTETNGTSLADYFLPFSAQQRDVLAIQLVTMGPQATAEAQRRFQNDEYQNYLFWHGFSVAMTEALAEYWHQHIRRELKIDDEDAPDIKQRVSGHFHGARFSLGYPACPDLADQQKIFHLLQPATIGVHLTETFQMVPEQSTAAFIVHHPQANRHFAKKN